MKYQPIGSKVLLKIIPIAASSVTIPDHLKSAMGTGKQQFFRVEALGPSAADEHHPLAVGQKVMISSHPTLLVGVDASQQLCVCNNKDISVICTEDDGAGLN